MTEPLEPEDLLAQMRDMLEEDPEQNAIIFIGQGATLTVALCLELPPAQTLYALNQIIESRGMERPEWAAVVSDSYYLREENDPELMASIGPGDLERMFKAGDSRVTEALMAVCVKPGLIAAVRQPYVRHVSPWATKSGVRFEWGEAQVLSEEAGQLGGSVTRGLLAMVRTNTNNNGGEKQ